jgi:hypothetical protein
MRKSASTHLLEKLNTAVAPRPVDVSPEKLKDSAQDRHLFTPGESG